MANGTNTVTNILSPYDIREGKVLEWEASRVKRGLVKLTFGSAQMYTNGVATNTELKTAMNLGTVIAANVVDFTKTDVVAKYNRYSGLVQIFGQSTTLDVATSGTVVGMLTPLLSGQVSLSGQSMIVEVIGT